MELENFLYMYKARVNRVVDGDTIDVTRDHGMRVYSEQRVRILGVDTPERGQENFKEASEFTRNKLENKEVIIQTYKDDAFGRYLANVYFQEDNTYKNISVELISKGLIKQDSKWNKDLKD